MITQIKISDLNYKIEEFSDDSPGSATWINLLKIFSTILSIVLIPFYCWQEFTFFIGIPQHVTNLLRRSLAGVCDPK